MRLRRLISAVLELSRRPSTSHSYSEHSGWTRRLNVEKKNRVVRFQRTGKILSCNKIYKHENVSMYS